MSPLRKPRRNHSTRWRLVPCESASGRDGAASDGVVAHGRGGVDAFLHVGLLQYVALPVGVVGPDARVAVGLELDGDADLGVAALLRGLPQHARQVLDVVPDLVRDDVGRREVAASAHPRELVEEREVDVDALIAGAVERAGGRGARPAGRRVDAVVEHEGRLAVGLAGGRRVHVLPHVLRLAEHGADVVAGLVVLRGRRLLHGRRPARVAEEAQQVARIGAEEEREDADDDERPAADGGASAHASAAAASGVDYVVTAAAASEAHGLAER